MEEDLPREFDLIVLGTGLPETIIAAAASRVGKPVLMLDSNTFYGRDWAGFRLKDLRDFLAVCGSPVPGTEVKDVSHLLKEGESAVPFGAPSDSISNFEEIVYMKDDIVEPDIAPQTRQDRHRRRSSRHASGSSNGSSSASPGSPEDKPFDETLTDPPVAKKQFGFEDLLSLSKKFNLDLAPKLFWTTDAFVNLLKTSDINRYAFVRLVETVATFIDGRIVEVPFSRSAISNHPDLSALDKRKVMKFMQMCMEFDSKSDKKSGDINPDKFGAYLDNLKIPAVTRQSIINAIALCTEDTPSAEAFSRVSRFLSACGQHSNSSSPFMFPLYGCGEYPQFFARVSAINGGVQCLQRGVNFAVVDATGSKVVAVISQHQRISCLNLVIPVENVPSVWKIGNLTTRNISRAILITDSSIFTKKPADVGFLRFSRPNDPFGVMVIEASSSAEVCPVGYFVVYLWTTAVSSARADLEPYVLKLFEPYRADRVGIPKVFWAAFFTQKQEILLDENISQDSGDAVASSRRPMNVSLVSGPSGSLDFEDVLTQSTEFFQKLYPGEPFLPRLIDPEDLVFDECDGPSTDVPEDQPPVSSSSNEDIPSSDLPENS